MKGDLFQGTLSIFVFIRSFQLPAFIQNAFSQWKLPGVGPLPMHGQALSILLARKALCRNDKYQPLYQHCTLPLKRTWWFS